MEQATLAQPVAGIPLTVTQLRALHNNLNKERVATRESGRQRLSYLEAWDVKATLIRVFGYAGFSAECIESHVVREEQVPQRDNASQMNWSVSYKATVRLTIHQTGAVYTESAIGNNKQPDYAEAADTALKSAESDALKRAATYLGTQFGLSLYDDGRLTDVVKTVLAPEQAEIISDITVMRANSAESQAAHDRLQARMKVHQTEVPAVPVEPTVTQAPATPVAVATVTAPATAVAKALENAGQRAAELDQAQADAHPRRKAPARKKPAKTVSADRQAVARQALAQAERATGTTPVRPGDEDGYYVDEADVDAVHQAREDAGL